MYSTSTPPVLRAIAPPSEVSPLWRSLKRYLTTSYVLPHDKHTMCTLEQRNNLYLLVDQVLGFGIEGDLVELGCYEGQTARVIASVQQQYADDRRFHVYDHFLFDQRGLGKARERLLADFATSGLLPPKVHAGDLWDMLPGELPERIAFLHIDVGLGDMPYRHARLVEHCLEHAYARMQPGAVGVLMDYHDPERTVAGWDCNPGVKQACDRFFRNRPEVIQLLYGREYSHAFFRKVL